MEVLAKKLISSGINSVQGVAK